MRTQFVCAILLLALSPLPAMAQERVIELDGADYATAAAAREAWRPIRDATPAVDVIETGGRRVLRLPCNFAASDRWRVAWDRRGRWNLADCQTVRLEVSADRGQIAGMILHLRSGDGWYGSSFAAPPGWTTIALPRKGFGIEGAPAGWNRIDGIRLSVLRHDTADRAILVRGVRAVATPAMVALYRNDAGIKRESGVPEYAARWADAFDRLGVAYEIVDDAAVAAGRLKGKRVAVLPLNPVLPKAAGEAVRRFTEAGGKVIACYLAPAPVNRLLGVQIRGSISGPARLHAFALAPPGEGDPVRVIQNSWLARKIEPAEETTVRAVWIDEAGKASKDPAVTRNEHGFFIGHVLTPPDQSAKDRLIQEMVGELWPGLWRQAYARRRRMLGRAAGLNGLAALAAAVEANAADAPADRRDRVARLMSAARDLVKSADEAEAGGDFHRAALLTGKAHEGYLRAYAASIPSKPAEFRGVWCHAPTGVRGLSWDEAMKRLADAGFTAVLPNMLWGGAAAYPSKVLPKATNVKGDQLAECVAAAKKHGIQVHVWKVNWNLWYNAPAAFKARMRKEGRVQVDAEGNTFDWLCPSHPDNRALEVEAMLEVARTYDVTGLHFDYIRYPGRQGCYCAGCRQRFEKAQGAAVKRWPADVIDGPLKAAYDQFRRDNITAVVKEVSEKARAIKPDIKISAAVFWNWSADRGNVGQDWKLWVEKGYLDFVCPMQYTGNPGLFDAQTRQTKAWTAGHADLMPGIGATIRLTPDGTLQQVLIARKHATAGFVLFNYSPALFEHLDLLKQGATRP